MVSSKRSGIAGTGAAKGPELVLVQRRADRARRAARVRGAKAARAHPVGEEAEVADADVADADEAPPAEHAAGNGAGARPRRAP